MINTGKTWRRILSIAVAILFPSPWILHAQVDMGPYLQNPKPDGVTVVWYTAAPESGVLHYGAAVNQLNTIKTTPVDTVHAVALTGLAPQTRYYYSVGSGDNTDVSGTSYYFETATRQPSQTPFRFIAFGDFGNGSQNQFDTAGQLEVVSPRAKFVLLLGDLIYETGLRKNFKPRYFDVYDKTLRNTAFLPAIGNHDNVETFTEFFYLPANNPEGTEVYYSFDYSNAHFVCIDDEGTVKANKTEEMLSWADRDLAAAKTRGQAWLVAYFHKPPYTSGTHTDNEFAQKNFVPRLEAAGVDLVLNGHSHVYERSYLLHGGKIINSNTNTYSKNGHGDGTLYVVSGCGGKNGSLLGQHELMAFQKGNLNGVAVIDIDGGTLKGHFRTKSGDEIDHYTLTKNNIQSGVSDANVLEGWTISTMPNPFHPTTTISVSLPESHSLYLSIYDLNGRLVDALAKGELYTAGTHSFVWNAQNAIKNTAATGTYFYEVRTDRPGSRKVGKMVLLH